MDTDNKYDFSDIAPFDDSEFSQKMARLVEEPRFETAIRFVMPDVDFNRFVEGLKQIPDKETFQKKVMRPFLEMLEMKTSSGITCGGLENISKEQSYTFLSNHRDIVLDASFLNLCLLRNGYTTSEVAIGNNLLIYEWISDLVKLNKSFIVKRGLRITQALQAARQLSAYIHYAINQKHESVWIAQREGRAKDSNDLTQESLMKMLALSGDGTFIDNLKDINVAPVAISYEYDPNDYLKVREFLQRRRDPEFKKSQHDDLLSMETGLLKFKGHIHFEYTPCINEELETLRDVTDKNELVKSICALIDRSIHSGYKIYGVNYIAYDMLHKGGEFAEKYTAEEVDKFSQYLEGQLSKVGLENVTDEEHEYMKEMMLTMYANPLRNKLIAIANKSSNEETED